MRRLSGAVLGLLVLAGCHKDSSHSPNGVVIDAAVAPVVSASASAAAPEVDAAVPVDAAAALSDVQLASSNVLPMLVPKETDDGAGDPLGALSRAIARAVTAARGDAGASHRYLAYVDTTVDYGCLCPPFVFAPFWSSGREDGTVLPVFAPGVPDPPLAKQGLYRFAGHFDGRRITGFDWLRSRGEKRQEGMEDFAKKAPVFVVEGWCFEPAAEYSTPDLEEVYAKTLAKMQRDGRFCAGSKLPKHAPKD